LAVLYLSSAVQLVKDSSTRLVLLGKLKHLALAMHMYHDTFQQFPPPALCDKHGRPLLSWRVLLLPYVEHDDLYQQFKLDEPWDSPHNLRLLERMPPLYALPDGFRTPPEPHATFFQVFVGRGAAFGKRSRGEGDSRTVGARDGDGHSAAIVAVGNTGRCPCFNADYAGLGRRLSARVSLLGVATPDRTTGCVGVSARRALRS
jgi:hypothetical protein